MKFSREVYEKFIQLVRSNPCLYDSSADHYKDFMIQRETWVKIAAQMNESGMTWEDWRRVWKQKRDGFIRKRKELHSNPYCWEAVNGKKISPLYDHFSFLIEHIKGSSASNMPDETQLGFSDGDQSTCSGVTVKDDPADVYIDKDDVEPQSPRFDIPSSQIKDCSQSQRLNESRASRRRKPRATSPPPLTMRTQITSRKRESEQKFERITEDSRSTTANLDPMENAVFSKFENQEDEGNVFHFLAKKMKTFSRDTQEWMEDEVLKIYMAAKRREKSFGKQ